MKRSLLILALFCLGTSLQAFEGYLSYETFQRLNDPAQEQKNSDWISLSFATDRSEKKFNGYIGADFRFYYANSDYMFSVPEGYLQYNTSNLKVTLGKQRLNWNRADARWGLGDLNGLQGFSLLGDHEEGIIGLNLDMKLSRRTRLEIFASLFHIPNLNPGYQFDGGKVSSRSEWVRLPPSQTTVLEEDLPIHYDYKEVVIKDIVFQESLGARLTFRANRKNSISGYALYKPENKLRMNAEGRLDESMDFVAVTANPYVNHHLLTGVNFKSQLGRKFFLTGGVERIDPKADFTADLLVMDPVTFFENDNDDFESDYFKIRPKQEANTYAHLCASWMGNLREFSVSFINSFNNFESGGDDFFGGTIKWRRAVGLQFKRHFSDLLNVSVDFKYDLLMKDSILRNEINYHIVKNFAVSAGVELLRSPKKSSYWSAYRSNDTFFTNLRYVF